MLDLSSMQTQTESKASQIILQCCWKSPQTTPRRHERRKMMYIVTGQVLDGSSRGLNTPKCQLTELKQTKDLAKVPKQFLASLWGTPARKPEKTLSIMASKQNRVRDRASHSRKQQTTKLYSVHWRLSHPRQSQGGDSLPSKVPSPSIKTVQPIRSQPPAWQWRWKQSPMPSAGLPQEMTVRPHMSSSSQIQWAATKIENWNGNIEQTGMSQWSTAT